MVLHLVHGAFPRGFIGPPAQETRSMSKSATGEMVILDFHHVQLKTNPILSLWNHRCACLAIETP